MRYDWSLQGSTLYNMYTNNTPQTPGVYLVLFADDNIYIQHIAKRLMFSENISTVSPQWSHGGVLEHKDQ
jgi:hypothetical protein